MSNTQAEREAAKLSKTQGPQYVVWVFGQGREVFDREQARRYAPLVQIEALFVDGVKVADAEIAGRLVAHGAA